MSRTGRNIKVYAKSFKWRLHQTQVRNPRFQTEDINSADSNWGLCGKQGPLTRTWCCERVICDDTDQYQLFSYSNVSCYRNHSRYTLCGFHHNINEGHASTWHDCQKCKEDIGDLETYVADGTSQFNFIDEKLVNPPTFEPCDFSTCSRVIKQNSEPYCRLPREGGFACSDCQPVRLLRPR